MPVRILKGDVRERLLGLKDESVHCVVTSPPYWGFRSYGGEDEMIGMEPNFYTHIHNLIKVCNAIYRVLRHDGIFWMNYGDGYTSGGRKDNVADTLGGGFSEARALKERRPMPKGLKPKDLMLMPTDIARALRMPLLECKKCEHVYHQFYWGVRSFNEGLICPYCHDYNDGNVYRSGWYLRSEVIWHKRAPTPESVKDRPVGTYEKVFMMTKSERYFYDNVAVRVPYSEGSISRYKYKMMDTQPTQRQPGQVDKRADFKNDVKDPNPDGANLRNLWTLGPEHFPGAHFATYPRTLPEICIKASTSEKGVCSKCGAQWKRVIERTPSPHDGHTNSLYEKGTNAHRMNLAKQAARERGYEYRNVVKTLGWEAGCECEAEVAPATVLDPFGGSGTTALAAQLLGRDSILCEINDEYVEMARKRIMDSVGLFGQVTVE